MGKYDQCRHGEPEGHCAACAACVACNGECGTCSYAPMTPAVPDPAVEALSEAEREVLCICPWDTSPPLPESTHTPQCSQHREAVERILAARAAAPDALRVRIEALAAEYDREADVICPRGEYDAKDKAWRVASVRRRVADDLRALLEDGAQ